MSAMEQYKSKFRRLAEKRIERDIAKKAAKKAEAEYREVEAEIIEELESANIKGVQDFTFEGDLGRIKFQKRGTIYGKIGDKNAALEAFENEQIVEEMTAPDIQARRLNELVRERLEAGLDLPDGVEFYERKFLSISFVQDDEDKD